VGVRAISFESIGVRCAAAGVAVFVLLISVFTFIWGFANTAASNAELKEVGDFLVSLSPSDPQTHFVSASLHEKALEAGDFETALREYEIAAGLAPHNYLLWLRLASIRGRAGDITGAEKSLRWVKELAPNYARANWALGNFLLREGQDEEAYAELRKAVAGDSTLALLAAATALQMSDGDARLVIKRFQNSPRINVALASLLAGQKKFDEAVDIWNATEPQDDGVYREGATQLRKSLIENKRFSAAITLKNVASDPGGPAFERITNPGFERPVKTQEADAFDWKVTQDAYPQVGVTDTQKRSGNYSLLVLLGAQGPKEFRGPSQLIAVRPGASYELNVSCRSDARSTAAFHWEVVSANDSKRLAISPPLGTDQNWTNITVPFAVPADTDGIEIRFVRDGCVGSNCNASGNFWFDDVELIAK
jgi:tetratricopeptide (TPR) repeat protein